MTALENRELSLTQKNLVVNNYNKSFKTIIMNKQGLSRIVNIENVTPKMNIFFRAWAIKTASPNLRFATALKKAWAIDSLRRKMQSGTVEFVYKKSDGTIRIAQGTLKSDKAVVKGGQTTKSYKQFNTMPYFDIEANGWRAFKVNQLVTIF